MKTLKNCAPPESITRQPGTVPDVVRLAVQAGSTAAAVVVEVDHVSAPTPPVLLKLPAASTPSTNLDAPAYRPTKRDQAYLAAVKELLLTRMPVTDRNLAKLLEVSFQRVAQFRQKPGFKGWLQQELRTEVDEEWPLLLKRASQVAMTGSIDHLNFIAKVRGEFKDGQLQPGGEKGLHVHLHV